MNDDEKELKDALVDVNTETNGTVPVDTTIEVAGRSYKNLDELKKAHDALYRDYSRISQGRPSKIKETPGTEENNGKSELDIIKDAADKLRLYGNVPSMEDIERKLDIREFVGSKNALASYDDLKLSKEEELIIEQRFKMGIPLEETYNALKSKSLVKHAGEEVNNYRPKHTGEQAINRNNEVAPFAEIKNTDYTMDNLGENIDKLFGAAGGVVKMIPLDIPGE